MKELYGVRVREPDKRRTEGPRAWDIKQLWDRSHEILNLNSIGMKGIEIAKVLNVSQATVSNTLNSTLGLEVRAEKRKARDEVYEKLNSKVVSLTEKSLEIYDRILSAQTNPDSKSFDPEVSLKMQKATADTIMLELSGMKAPTKIDTRSMSVTLSSDEIDELKRRGMEAAKAAGKMVEE